MECLLLYCGMALQYKSHALEWLGSSPGPLRAQALFARPLGTPLSIERGRDPPEGSGKMGLISQPSGGVELASIRSGGTGPVLRPSGEAELMLLPLGKASPLSLGVGREETRVPAIGWAGTNAWAA
jgi:hypothetical protein